MLFDDFLSTLKIQAHQLPVRLTWVMQGAVDFPCTAQLDYNNDSHRIEFGIYETIDGQTQTATGGAQLDTAADMVEFDSLEDEQFFERFVETVRLMTLDQPSSDDN